MLTKTGRIPPTDEQFEAINTHATKSLVKLLRQHEKSYGNSDYEWKFIGNLFAQMILAGYMGYHVDELGKDAEAAGERLIKLAEADND